MSESVSRRSVIRVLGAMGAAAITGAGCTGSEKGSPVASSPTTAPAAGKIISAQPSVTDRPNFVIILTDDQGYGDLGCFGSQDILTPNIDRMAAEGCRLTDFYVGAPICTPSRAALMTGCYPQRVGLPQVLGPQSDIGISSDEMTLAQVLKARGYATACYGKWHLGHHAPFLPIHHGFDEYFGLPYSNDMWPLHPTTKFPDLPLIEGDKVVNPKVGPNDQRQLTTWYTDHAVDFIRRNKDRPFFLYVPHNMPHVPLHVSDKYKGKSARGLYGDVIMEIDWSVGQILRAIAGSGVDQRTFVIFTSDNGPWLAYGDHAGSAGPLREGKHTTFEGGQRVPCVMRWPGQIPGGRTVEPLVTSMDILPTFARLAGAKPPALPIDGVDVWQILSGRDRGRLSRGALFYYLAWDLQGVRSGRWKLHLPHPYQHIDEPGTGGLPGKTSDPGIALSLFDLATDIGERTDISAAHPELVQRLRDMLAQCREDLGDGKYPGKNRRPPGKV